MYEASSFLGVLWGGTTFSIGGATAPLSSPYSSMKYARRYDSSWMRAIKAVKSWSWGLAYISMGCMQSVDSYRAVARIIA